MQIHRVGQRITHYGSDALRYRSSRGGAAVPALTLTAVTTGAGQTVTIHRCTPTVVNVTIAWGDGNTTVVAPGDTANKSNVYAAAGTYPITVTPASAIVQLDIHDSKLSGFKSAQLAGNVLTYFICNGLGTATTSVVASSDMSAWRPATWYLYAMPAGTYTINSSDMSAWRPETWVLYSMPAGTYTINSSDISAWRPTNWVLYAMPAGTYTINSSDMSAWRPTNWYLYAMPAGTYTINSSDMSAWRPTYWFLYAMPAGTYTIASSDMSAWRPTQWRLFSITGGGAAWTLAAADFAGWTTATTVRVNDNALIQAQVNAVLYGMHLASVAPRTVTGGTINVGGTNAAPSGVYQACAACPVGAATPGKEVAWELTLDSCGAFANHWTTVTFTA
jgi:hypothetical protein